MEIEYITTKEQVRKIQNKRFDLILKSKNEIEWRLKNKPLDKNLNYLNEKRICDFRNEIARCIKLIQHTYESTGIYPQMRFGTTNA